MVEIRQLIQRRMNTPVRLHNRQGDALASETVLREYAVIKQFLLDHYNHEHDIVAIKQHKDYRYFLTILACMEIGTPYIPFKHDYPEDRVQQIQEDAKFTLLLDDHKMSEVLSYTGKKLTALKPVSPELPLYTIFTSGSTGRPKGVTIQRKAWQNFCGWVDTELKKLSADDRLLQVTEFTFDISLLDVALFLTKNVSVYFSNFENNMFKLGYEVETHRISILNTVPNNLNMFLSDMVADRMDYRCLKHLYIAGARFSYGLYQKCLKYFERDVDVYNLYGPTEATIYSHYKKLTYQEPIDVVEGNVSIGRPLPGMTAHIVMDGQIKSAGERGELYIGGAQLMREYVNNPEQTKKVLVSFNGETHYTSGDLAFRSESGEYFVVGRTDDTIKVRGFRVNLLDIDSYITRLPYVQDAVTIALPHESNENTTVSFLILKEEKSHKEIKSDLTKLLLDFQIPEKFVFVTQYPTNTSGKVCRKTLKADYLEAQSKA
jgi:acyl-coenzyme A synthetase/AMP-(fatty) acid ligase